jgi:nicotinate-nucleotide adenylyltransferase
MGGAFDPPHVGHVALARGALSDLGADRVLVLVSERPGHKPTVLDAPTRLELARLAFADVAGSEVRLDPHAYTVDLLRDEPFDDAVLVVGADQWAVFDTWNEPDEIRRLIPIAVAARPGQPVPGDDVRVFRIEQHPVSSSEIRAHIAAGAPIDGLVPAPVAREIARRGLYAGGRLK